MQMMIMNSNSNWIQWSLYMKISKYHDDYFDLSIANILTDKKKKIRRWYHQQTIDMIKTVAK